MKSKNYKLRTHILFLGVMCSGALFAQAIVVPTTSEVTGTLSTGLGNSAVSGIVISVPIASPGAGSYTSAQSVTLTSSGSLSIRYTTDNTLPTCTTGTVYAGAISVASTQTVKAIACYANNIASSVASYSYSINPIISGGGGGGGGSSYTPPFVPATTTVPAIIATATPVISSSTRPAPVGQVLGVQSFMFLRDLRIGSRGNDVTELQKILIKEGFLKGEATGYFGTMTRKALIAWEIKNNLVVSENFGAYYRDYMNKKYFASVKTDVEVTRATTSVPTFIFLKDLSVGSRGNDVTELQKILVAEKYLVTSTFGVFDQKTRIALSKWQTKNKIRSTGYFGPLSRQLMNKR